MAQEGVVADGEDGGVENTGLGEVGSSDRVDAPMLAMQATVSDAAVDRSLGEAAVVELTPW